MYTAYCKDLLQIVNIENMLHLVTFCVGLSGTESRGGVAIYKYKRKLFLLLLIKSAVQDKEIIMINWFDYIRENQNKDSMFLPNGYHLDEFGFTYKSGFKFRHMYAYGILGNLFVMDGEINITKANKYIHKTERTLKRYIKELKSFGLITEDNKVVDFTTLKRV